MLACIPTEDDAGLEARVCGHFGSAPYFTLYDTESRQVRTLANGNAHHAHGTCHPLSQLAGLELGCIVVAGMGRRAVDSLRAAGIAVYRAPGARVSDAVAGLAAGTLPALDAAHACGGHGHGGRGGACP